MGELISLSFSRMAEYRKCGRLYYFNRLDPEAPKPPKRHYLITGSAYHAGVGLGLKEKKKTGLEPNLGAMQDAYIEALRRPTDRDGQELEVTWPEDIDQNVEEAQGVELVGLYRSAVMPSLWPENVEQAFNVDFKNRPWRLVVIPDFEGETKGLNYKGWKKEKLNILIDHKKTAKAPSDGEADYNEQLTAYALAKYADSGQLPDVVRLDWAISWKTAPKKKTAERLAGVKETKNGAVGILPMSAKRTLEDINHYLSVMETTAKALESNIFNYAPPVAWYCTPKACDFWEYCRKRGPI